MRKVLMLPTPTQAAQNTTNSIHNIILALQKHFPAYGYELTENPAEADLIVGHAGQTYGQGDRLDVAHCHGLYPTAQFGELEWHFEANAAVIYNLKSARAVTVPSQWVADILRRDMHLDPDVVGWAIEPDEWTPPDQHKGYVLWNKTRPDKVCDPAPALDLARRFANQDFITTFGQGGDNVRTIGLQPYANMHEIVRHAEIYLATTKETWGIGTVEAMASGVPILGYRWGGTADIVEHGKTGFLVEPGDLDGLAEGLLYCKKHRATLGANARQVALTYTWARVAQQFAAIYDRCLIPHGGPKVSVVIPLHNYARFIGGAVGSVINQQTAFEVELIVVENGSTDNSYEVAKEVVGDKGTVIRLDGGVGPARARNYGIEWARGDLIVCLDADDELGHPEFLQRLAAAFDRDPSLGIAFTGLAMFREVNDQREFRQGPWPDGFSYDEQANGHNQVPTCAMFRKTAWQRAGGYRSLNEPAEDAEFWLRITTIGYGAMQVTKEPWFYYRWHEQSLSHPVRSQQIHEPNWRRWFANTQGLQRPLAAGGNPPRRSWPVRNYDRPLVTFIVPVGAGHERYLKDALDSIEGQTDRRWACIVVNDTGQPLTLPGQSWAKVIDTAERKGPGHARNVGLQAATSPLIAFLDADDLLEVKFLELCLTAYSISGRYVYTDWMTLNAQGHVGKHETPEYEAGIVFQQTSIHAISILIERQHLLKVGGFDESMPAWEDVDLFMKLAAAGICGQRVAKPLLYYRHETGTVRERGETVKAELKALLFERYKPYMLGDMMCDCGNKPKAKLINGNGATASAQSAQNGEMARVLYQGPKARHDVYGGATKQYYGRRAGGDVFLVWERDQIVAPLTFVPIAAIEDIIEPTPMPPEPELV